MKPKCQKQGGLTLIEMLVVIAIIGMLAALLLPELSLAKGYAKSASCKNHLHQMGIALQLYVNENRTRYPHYLGPAGPAYGDAVGEGGRAVGLVYWSSKLFPYYPLNWTNTAFQCPGYSGNVSGPYLNGAINRLGSYAYNSCGARIGDRSSGWFGLGPVLYWKDARGNYVPPVSEGEVRVPSEMLAMGDSARIMGAIPGSGVVINPPASGGDDWGHCDLNASSWIYDVRHGKIYNQVLCDGHVSAMIPSTFFSPSNTAAMWNYDHDPHPELWTP